MRNRSGFTLIEVLAALLISGLAVTIAAAVFASMSQATESLTLRSELQRLDTEAMLWLRDGLLAADISVDSEREFIGTANRVSFIAWLPVPTGWSEPIPVEGFFERGRLRVRVGTSTYTQSDSLDYAAFDYLPGFGSSSPWLSQWNSRTGAPVAIRVRRGHANGAADTTLLYVGRTR